MGYFLAFILGACVGSFLNVCIYRLPLGKSIIWPPSHCPGCKHPILWYDNIPLISYVVLKNRCRHCGDHIPVRYFIVELITALSGMLLLYYFTFSAEFFVYGLFTCALITVVFIDIEHQEIPDVITVPGIAVAAVLMTVFRLDGSVSYLASFVDSVFGILAGGGSMFLLGVVGELIFRREALGGGDMKLMAMIGALLGWKLVLLTFFIAPVLGLGIGLFMKFRRQKDAIPYAPYLALGALISLFYGYKILDHLFVF